MNVYGDNYLVRIRLVKYNDLIIMSNIISNTLRKILIYIKLPIINNIRKIFITSNKLVLNLKLLGKIQPTVAVSDQLQLIPIWSC